MKFYLTSVNAILFTYVYANYVFYIHKFMKNKDKIIHSGFFKNAHNLSLFFHIRYNVNSLVDLMLHFHILCSTLCIFFFYFSNLRYVYYSLIETSLNVSIITYIIDFDNTLITHIRFLIIHCISLQFYILGTKILILFIRS